MQPHAGVQVVIVGLAGHVGHGEVHRRAVGDGHCRGHREKQREIHYNYWSSVSAEWSFAALASGDAQLIAKQLDWLLLMRCV